MKILIGGLLCFLLIFGTSAGKAEDEAVITGGWAEVSVDDEEVEAAAQFAVAGHDVAVSLIAVSNARQQIVAGVNYQLLLKVTVDGVEKEAEAVVWKQLSGEYKLTSWTLR